MRFPSRVIWIWLLSRATWMTVVPKGVNILWTSRVQKMGGKIYIKIHWWILKEFVSMTVRKRHIRPPLGNANTDPVTRPKSGSEK
uniref:Putative secreted protein n=1 Tax=Ixodes scapularis TaxID=6945 RepID=A0A4D5RB13_IXOSC